MCIFFFSFYGISPCGGCQTVQKELSNIHCPIHTITAYNTGLRQRQARVIGDKPSGADHPQPATSSLHITPLRKSPRLVKLPPRQILRHPFLSCMLSFASWMLRPFLSNVSFTPFIQLFLGLLLLLTPLTSESYTLLTNLSFPILSTCPNHLSTPSH